MQLNQLDCETNKKNLKGGRYSVPEESFGLRIHSSAGFVHQNNGRTSEHGQGVAQFASGASRAVFGELGSVFFDLQTVQVQIDDPASHQSSHYHIISYNSVAVVSNYDEIGKKLINFK